MSFGSLTRFNKENKRRVRLTGVQIIARIMTVVIIMLCGSIAYIRRVTV